MNKNIYVSSQLFFVTTIFVLILSGCGSSMVLDDMAKEATVNGMTNTTSDIDSTNNKFKQPIGVQEVSAIQDRDSVWEKYHISEDNFKEALFTSLKTQDFVRSKPKMLAIF